MVCPQLKEGTQNPHLRIFIGYLVSIFSFLCSSRIDASSFTLGVAGLLCLVLFLLPRSPSTQPVGSSLTLDLDATAGDQAVSSLDLLPDQSFSIQIFGKNIQGVTGISARLRFDAAQVAYEGFDAGDAVPNARAVAQPDSTSVLLDVSSSGGSAAANTGLVGTLRLRTTPAFSDTEIWLVDAELVRDGQTETISPAVGVTLQAAAPPSPDFDGNGLVGFSDFVAFAGVFGAQRGDSKFEARFDLNNDGAIGFEDFVAFAGSFGEEANRAPTFGEPPPVTRTVDENTPAGQPVGNPVTATDADGDSLTYRLRGVHADSFAIASGTGQLLTKERVAYDHEARGTYSLTVRASDGHGGRATVAVDITVTDVAEPPSSAPDSVRVASRDSALAVTWYRAADEAGKPLVSGYEVGHKQAEAEAWPKGLLVEGRTDTSVTLAGLTNEQAYHVRVRTLNEEGSGPWAAPVAGAPTPGPRPRGVIRDLEVNADSSAQVNLANLFTRPVLGTLKYGATSSNEGVATVTVADTLAVVRGVAAGRATLTATAGDAHGNSAQTTFGVIVRSTSPPSGPGGGGGGGGGPVGPFIPPPPPQPPANNRAPAFDDGSSTSRTVAENTPAGRPIQHPVNATDPDGHRVTYRLSGPDSASFSVDAGSGQLRTLSGITYDFEDSDRYTVTVDGSDPFGESATIDVTIHVADVNEPPEVPAAPLVQPASTTSLTVTWDPPDNTGPDIFDYDVQYRKSGSFIPHSHDGPGTSATIGDLDVNTRYEVQVRATNDEGTSVYSRSGFGNTSTTLPPVFDAGSDAAREVEENTTGVQDVGAPVSASDPENTTVTYSLTRGDTESFDVDENTGQLQTKTGVDYDFETKDRYSVTVQAQDEHGGRATVSVTIAVTDDDSERPETPDKPTVTASTSNSLSVRWTAPVNTGPAINDYDVQYREGTSGAFSPWTHDGPGTSTTITGLTANTDYQVQVLARSPEGESPWSESVDARTSANRAPTFNEGTSATRSFAENTTGTTDIGNPITARDNDGGTPEYSLSGADAASFTIDAGDGQLQTVSGTTYDYEEKSRYDVTVRVEDGQGGSNTIAVRINLTDQQERPGTPDAPDVAAASSTSLEVTWDAPANTGPDINDYDVQYRQGDSGGFRSWTHNSADLTATITALIPDSSYQVQVLARSPEGTSDWSESGTGSTDPNQLPIFTDGSSATRNLDENTTGVHDIGDPVGATDPEMTTPTYALEGTHADSFSIDTRSGQLKTRSGRTYDFEALSRYSVDVKATDGHGGESSIPVSIDLTDLNEAPVFTGEASLEAAENQSFAGTVTAADPDGADNITDYALTGGSDRARLEISNAGALTFRDDPDFENPVDAGSNNSYVVEVTATGGSGGRALTAAQTVTVTVTDENEPPHFTSDDAFKVKENQQIVGKLTARDIDRDDTITGYGVTGGADQDRFEIDSTNHLRFRDDPDFERPADAGGDNEYIVEVTAAAGAATRELTGTQTVTVAIEDEDEPPGQPDPPAVSNETESSLTVTWTEPDNAGPVITNYHMQYRHTGSYIALSDSGAALSRTITGLRSGRTYQVQVQAKNDEGEGPWSNPGSGTTLTAPTVSSVAFTSTPASGQNSTYNLSDTLDVTATFSEAVTVTGTPQIDLTLGSTARKADYESGSTTTQLLFQYAVQAGDEDTDGASVDENGLKLNNGRIFLLKNSTTINADLVHAAVANQSGHKVDGLAPTLTDVEVKSDELTLTYKERFDATSEPEAGDFAVTVDGEARGVNAVTTRTSEVALTLASAVSAGEKVVLAYTPGINPIRDPARNPAGALSNLTVANRTPVGNVCARTAQVRDEIVRQAPVSTCGDVAADHLAAIEEIFLNDESISALKAGDFAGLTALQLLDLGSNSIGSLPANAFSELGSLIALDLADNSITALQTNAFSGLSALQDLYLDGNSLASLHANAFSGLTALVALDLSDNALATLPANGFSALTALEDLYLSDNELENLGANAFSGLTALTDLQLDGNDLGSLDASLFSGLTALTHLNVSDAEVTGLAANGFSGLSALEHLDLDFNDLGSLDASAFSGLSALEVLDLSHAGITGLPATVFSGLSALEILRLSGNEPGSLDAGLFSGLTALENLDLGWMKLSSVDASLLSSLTTLRVFSLSGNDLTELPATLFSGLTELRWLFLKMKLSSLPDGLFSGLTGLTRLRLAGNTVDPLPVNVSLEAAGSQFRAEAHTAAPFELVLPLRLDNGEIDSGEETITITQGSIQSDFLSVSRTSGTTRAVTVDLGVLPELPGDDDGYALVRSADLPLEVIAADDGVEIYPTVLTMPEDDSDTYTVVLTSEPTADVTVTVTVPSGADVTVDPSPLTFTDQDWDTPQTVTVSSSADTDSDDDEVILAHAVSGGYQGVTADDVKVTVTETDVSTNRAPVFATTSFDVKENETEVATLVATDADARDYVTGYEITGGTDQAHFDITGRGELSFTGIPDYERPAGSSNRYVINVTATSGMGARERSRQQQITVSVTDVDEPPGPPGPPMLDIPFRNAPHIGVNPSRRLPANTGPDITSWRIQFRVKDTGDFIGYSDRQPDWTDPDWFVFLRNLNRATTYEVQVAARNAEGTGEWSPSAEIEVPNQSPVVDGSIDDATLPVGGAVAAVSGDDVFDDPDDVEMSFTASSSNTASAPVQVSGAQVLVDPKTAGSATITVTASDPWGETASTTFDVDVQAPTLSAPTLGISGDLFTLEFSDDFAAEETRAYEIRIRQKEPIGDWAIGCYTETNTGVTPESIAITVQDLVSDFFEPGSTYEADYGYIGADCTGSLSGVRSAVGEATVPGTPAFDIELIYAGGTPARRIRSAFETATKRWERIIARDIPNHRVSESWRSVLESIYPGTTAPELVDDMVVYVEIVHIDGSGGTAGRAGRLVWRHPSSLPVAAFVELDQNDVPTMSSARLEALILHELGHTLGIGLGSWRDHNLLRDPSQDLYGNPVLPTPDTYFSGANAIAAFNAAGGSSYTGARVPVENTSPNAGSRDSHWRESVLQHELMTPRIGEDSPPLSAITIQSLADIGYTVKVTQADAYTLPSTSTSKIASGSDGLNLQNCIVTHPDAGPDQPEPIILNLRRVTEVKSQE